MTNKEYKSKYCLSRKKTYKLAKQNKLIVVNVTHPLKGWKKYLDDKIEEAIKDSELDLKIISEECSYREGQVMTKVILGLNK